MNALRSFGRRAVSLSGFLLGALGVLFISLSPGKSAPPQVFTDSDGDTYTVTLSAGTAQVTLDDLDLDQKGPIASITVSDTKTSSALKITVKKFAGDGMLPPGDGKVSIGAITSAGPLGSISATASDLIGVGITVGGAPSSVKLANIADGVQLTFGVTAKPKALAITAGEIGAATITAPGSTLNLNARRVGPGAVFTAPLAGTLKATAGSFEGVVLIEGKMVGLLVAGGNFSGRLLAASINSISVKKNKAGLGGSIVDSTITAGAIGAVLVDVDIVNSLLLAGATLGADGALGGTGADADTFGPGSFRTLLVKRNVTGSVIGAGLVPVDGILRDANDGVTGGKKSKLSSVTIGGQLDAMSRIAAGLFPKTVLITKVRINPLRDARFIARAFVVPPAPVPKPLDPSVAMPAATSTDFLYTGPDAVQTGVAPGTIKPERAAVLRGRVLQRDGSPLPGVTISVLDHPEYGQTNSRADGRFDFAVNGGAKFVVNFEAGGFCPVQRQVDPARQDFETLDDVVMIGVDPLVTQVTLGTGSVMQMHESSVEVDDSDPRHAALLFQPDTTATFKLADGTTLPVTTPLNIRASEFTVGPNGPNAMPGALPSNSAYTYCAELTADETPPGATLEFSKPVFFYLENFLNFEIGIEVPSGFYNAKKGQWEAGPSGRVIKILSETAGAADLDVTGDGNADTGPALDALGITDAERTQLATSYAAGQSLWRVPIPHFSPWDCNWPFGPPAGSSPPDGGPPQPDNPPDDPEDPARVFIQTQELGESLRVAGTPFTLNYRSARAAGNEAARRIAIPLSGATIPAPLKRIELEVSVAGQTFTQDFAAAPNLSTVYQWDGRDAYGRVVQGRQPAKVRVGFVYDGSYQRTNLFGTNGTGTAITGDRTREEITISTNYDVMVGTFEFQRLSLGGWTLDVHHAYDPAGRTLHQGDGNKRSVQSINSIIDTVIGLAGTPGFSGDGGPAKEAQLSGPSGIAIGPDGAIYIADFNNARIRKVDADGIITTFAGNGTLGFSGDGGPALAAQISTGHIRFAPDGSLHLSVTDARLRRIDPSGIITTIAGNGVSLASGDNGPAINATVTSNSASVPAADGTIYFSELSPSLIRAIKPDGTMVRVAGGGGGGDGGPALAAALSSPTDLALGPDEAVWIGDTFSERLRRVGADGIITTVAGGGNPAAGDGDGGPATQARIRIGGGSGGTEMASDSRGNVYFTERATGRIRRVSADGTIVTVAGNGTRGYNGDGGPAIAARIESAGLAVAPDGAIYFADIFNHVVRRIAPPLPGFDGSEFAIPAGDGTHLFRFDATGRHLSTTNTLTGATLYSFAYDSAGQLVKITDGDGNVTTIQRTAGGNPTAIVGPYGAKTLLTTDANGFLSGITDPSGGAHAFTYDANGGGLLTGETDPVGNFHAFTYDAIGRLTKSDPAGPGFTDLDRVEVPGGYFVTATTAMGLVKKLQTVISPTGDELATNTDTAGLVTTIAQRENGTLTTTGPDGTIANVTFGPDPRWQMQPPVAASSTLQSPGGKMLATTLSRAVTFSAPLKLATQTDTATINGKVYTSVFDAATRTYLGTTPEGREHRSKIDLAGREIERQLGETTPVKIAYDARGRVGTVTWGTAAVLRKYTHAYDSGGRLLSVTDPVGGKIQFGYDANGRITRQKFADGREALYAYDAAGNLLSFTPPGRSAHVFTYNSDALTTSYTAPALVGLPNQTAYTYDADRRPLLFTRPGGQTIGFTYAPSGKPATQIIAEGTYTFTSDPVSGRPSGIMAPGGVRLTYTRDGWLITGLTWTGPVAGTVGRTVNNNFKLASETINGGSTINFTFDNDMQLTGAGALTIARDPKSGAITGTTLGGIAETHVRNQFGEVTETTVNFGGTPLFAATYTFDKLGRILTKTETIGGIADALTFSYDPAQRLKSVLRNGAPFASYTYDANSNRLTTIRNGVTTNGTYDAQDRLTDFGANTYTYNAAGDLTGKTTPLGTTTYQSDALGNLRGVTLPDATQIDYVIDGQNRRLGKRVNGTLTKGFLYHDDRMPAAELDGAGNLVSRFVYGTRDHVPDYLIKGGVTYRIITDHLGSPRLVVDAATGVPAQRMDYDEWGHVTADTAPGFQPFGFAGGLYDPDTKLTRFGARDYDAETGRWTRQDPVLFIGGSANLYGYVINDPQNRIDPSGLKDTYVEVSFYNLRPDFSELGGPVLNTPFAGGHAAVGIGGGPSYGNYPSGVIPEGSPQATSGAPDRRYRIPITCDQARKLRDFIKRKRKEGHYDLFNNNCADFVADALAEVGVDVGDILTPLQLEDHVSAAGGFPQ